MSDGRKTSRLAMSVVRYLYATEVARQRHRPGQGTPPPPSTPRAGARTVERMHTDDTDPHTGLALAQPARILVTDADLSALAWAEAMWSAHALAELVRRLGVEHAA